MAANGSVILNFSLSATAAGSVPTTGQVVGAGDDAGPGNETAGVDTPVSTIAARDPKAANLKLTFTGPARARPNKGVKYKAALQNLGPAAAGSVQLDVAMPEGAGFVGAASDRSCSLGAGVIHCNMGNLNARKTRRIMIALKLWKGWAIHGHSTGNLLER